MSRTVLIVGLGNPGSKYTRTRHNIGFMILEAFAKQHGLDFKDDKRLLGKVAKGQVSESNVRLLLPQTYMNSSGMSVRKNVDYFNIDIEDILVISDDVSLQFGTLRLRTKGGAGGHNGLKDIQCHLNSTDYARLKVGVDGEYLCELSDYVLSNFSSKEQSELGEIITKGVDVIQRWLCDDVHKVMNDTNIRKEQRCQSQSGDEKDGK